MLGDASDIVGIKATIYNMNICQESGIFFCLDQFKWRKKESLRYLKKFDNSKT